ncbi:MAG: histidine phosphatase family protein, partial [Proteobacteria bacterium]|nr:histidine phosphatase family protein [Pseudomonadota bacterium]
SPYIRALETATAIHRATGAPLEAFPPIHEHHITPFPEAWPLLDRHGLAARFPHLLLGSDFPEPGWHHPPETDAQALDRMGTALDLVRTRFANDPERDVRRICLVSHGSPTGKIVMAFLGQTIADPDIRDVMLVDRRKRFQRCPSGPMDRGGGLQGPDIGAAENQVQMAHAGKADTGCLCLALTEFSQFAVDRRIWQSGVCLRLGVAHEIDQHCGIPEALRALLDRRSYMPAG